MSSRSRRRARPVPRADLREHVRRDPRATHEIARRVIRDLPMDEMPRGMREPACERRRRAPAEAPVRGIEIGPALARIVGRCRSACRRRRRGRARPAASRRSRHRCSGRPHPRHRSPPAVTHIHCSTRFFGWCCSRDRGRAGGPRCVPLRQSPCPSLCGMHAPPMCRKNYNGLDERASDRRAARARGVLRAARDLRHLDVRRPRRPHDRRSR